MTTTETITTGERADLLETLATHRYFLRFTVRDLTDDQAARRTAASQLCLGGLVKHVAATEQRWMNFVLGGADAMTSNWEGDWEGQFRMLEGETLAGLLEYYDEVAHKTDQIVATLPTWTCPTRCPRPPGSNPAHAGRRAGSCST